MDRRTSQSPLNYDREAGTERRALRAGNDRRKHHRVLRVFFIPLDLLVHKLRTGTLAF
jgi:hypothetical protein